MSFFIYRTDQITFTSVRSHSARKSSESVIRCTKKKKRRGRGEFKYVPDVALIPGRARSSNAGAHVFPIYAYALINRRRVLLNASRNNAGLEPQ